MDKPLVVLITGASSGMGKEFSKTMRKEDMVVYAAARRISHMDDLMELGVIPLEMDITKDADIQRVVDRVISDQGRIDVLINTAGFALMGPVEEIPMEEARYQFEVNLFGLARLTQLILPHMREKGAGRIINISSALGRAYVPMGAWYVSTKHALEGWSDCLRLEVKPFGIDVVIIQPGIIKTGFVQVVTAHLSKRLDKGPYKEFISESLKFAKSTSEKGGSSHPEVIASVVLEAIKAKHPKTRYVAGKLARVLIFMRKWLGDKLFDRFIMMR